MALRAPKPKIFLTFIMSDDEKNSNNLNKEPRVPKGKSDGAYLQALGPAGATNKFQAKWFHQEPPEGQSHQCTPLPHPNNTLRGMQGLQGGQQQKQQRMQTLTQPAAAMTQMMSHLADSPPLFFPSA